MTRTLRIRRGSVAFLSTLAWAMLAGGASALAASPPSTAPAPAGAATQSCPAMLNLTFPRLQDDSPQDLCQFAGRVVLVVGSDLGLDEPLRNEAAEVWALSRLTLPHLLARVLILEQLYRGLDIAAGGRYHRA